MGKEETQIMKRATRMLILAAVLVVVIIGYVAITRLTAEDSAEGVGGSDVTVFSVNTATVTELSWEYDEEEILLKKVGGTWQYSGDSAFPLSMAKVNTMLTAISEVKASRSIEDIAALSEYGLDDPTYKIRISSDNGPLVTCSIGDKNEITGDYYLIIDDRQTVYMVDGNLPDAFGNTLMDIVERETVPDVSSAETLIISTPHSDNKIVYKSSHSGITYTNAYKWFYEFDVDGNKGYAPLGMLKVNKLQNQIKGIVWQDCVEYNATDEALKTYGLDEPRVTVTAKLPSGDFTLMLGDFEGERCYAKTGNSGIVYTISTETADSLAAVDFESLRADDVCLMEWNTVDSMEILVDGKTRTIYFERSEEGDVSYLVDGYPGESEKVDKFLRSIDAMTTIDQTDKPSPFSEPEVKIVFHRNTEYFHTMVLSLYLYDSQSYLVEFDGQSRLLVGIDDVGRLKEAFGALNE